MAKKPTITTVSSGYTSQDTINTNFENIEDAFENTISRDGSTPNTMEADLDMNGNGLLNVGDISLDGSDTLQSLVSSAETSATSAATSASDAETAKDAAETAQAAAEAAENSLLEWQGAWTTSTAYDLSDIVRESGSSYICIEAHTSGTFSTDLAAAKWELFAQQGAAGAGTGDMLAANNLSDVSDADSSLSNLGGTTVGKAVFKSANASAARTAMSAQEEDATLTALAGTLTAANKIPYATGADTAGELDFVDEDDMSSDSATAIPSQQSVKAYVDASSSAGGSEDFSSDGTWSKPAGIDGDRAILVELWGGGGGGYGGVQLSGCGGGGGSYTWKVFRADDLSSSVAVTVGQGGAAGSHGTSTTFGSYLTAYGGASGGTSDGGVGAGLGESGALGGWPGGGSGNGGDSSNDGAGGGGGRQGDDGGRSVKGGGGGGGYEHSVSSGNGGSSVYGGDGGDANNAGSVPSGGGGFKAAGADGQARVTIL